MIKTIISQRYTNATIKNINPKIAEMVEESVKKRKGQNLYIFGDSGVGKTYIAYAIYNFVKDNDLPCAVVKNLDIVDAIKGTFIGLPEQDNPRYNEILAKLDLLKELETYKGLLIIDDVGVEKSSEAVIVKLFQIINERYEWMLPTIYTSNYDLNELKEKVGDRIVGRMAEDCIVIKLEGENKRA